MDTMSRRIYPISNITRETCFDMRRFPCCGDQVQNVENFRLDLYREGKEDDLLLTYEFFYVNEETGHMCILWDDAINDLCYGRYIGHIWYDCIPIDKIRLFIGGKFTVEGVTFRDSTLPHCFSNEPAPVDCDGTSMCAGDGGAGGVVEPDTCCDGTDDCDRVACCTCEDRCTGECLSWQENKPCR